MTKYEWETELKKNIHRLPPDEIRRVMEYYGELFDDYAERGKRETEIINEFGNPVDVADKILAEFDSENAQGDGQGIDAGEAEQAAPVLDSRDDNKCGGRKDDTPRDTVSEGKRRQSAYAQRDVDTDSLPRDDGKKQTAERKSGGADMARVALLVLLTFFTGGMFFVAFGVVWILLGALALGGGAAAAGGVFAFVISLGLVFTGNAGAGFAQLGIGVAAIGIGIMLLLFAVKLIKLGATATKKIFAGLRNWLTAKKESV